jgi:hypothetical protein
MSKLKMRRIRGEYRPFFEALFTGKDFSKLSPDAKLAYLFVKGLSGAAGIKVWPAFFEQLAELTGMPTPRTKRAVAELVAAERLAIEASVVWVVRGLDFEPQLHASNDNHRIWLREHLDSLPRVSMLDTFEALHPEWFGMASEGPAQGPTDSPRESLPKPKPIPNNTTLTLTQTPTNGEIVDVSNGGHKTRLVLRFLQGVTELFGEPTTPPRWDSKTTYDFAEALHAAGVPLAFAEERLYELAKTTRPSDGKPPGSLKYFTAPVVSAWESEQVHAAMRNLPVPATKAESAEPTIPDEWAIDYAQKGAIDWQAECDARGIEWRVAS